MPIAQDALASLAHATMDEVEARVALIALRLQHGLLEERH
jgi:hypothetical protein